MDDIIRLLPEQVASQIAAGEVIQRPASVVKELVENAVDAGSKNISVYIKDGGRALIQVSDDGSGMGPHDARICWERHATSKIRVHDDLYSLTTMGFRGEALASIAAVSQVDLKTRKNSDEIGTHVIIEGGEIKNLEPTSANTGTIIQVRNLFFNVPARRQFLKSNAVEFRHISDEIIRIALARCDIHFKLNHQSQEVFDLYPETPSERFRKIFHTKEKSRMLEAHEETPYLQVKGWISKPAEARKTRGEQFFFINGRYFKDGYLHHAVMNACESVIAPGTYPSYLIYLTIDPARIDVNVHPQKTEIKFEDERTVYQIIRAIIKKAIAGFIPAPSFDFNTSAFTPGKEAGMTVFSNQYREPGKVSSPFIIPASGTPEWKKNLDPFVSSGALQNKIYTPESNFLPLPSPEKPTLQIYNEQIFQVFNSYILFQQDNSLLVIDQAAAYRRIHFEKIMKSFSGNKLPVQQKLFPRVVELSIRDMQFFEEIQSDLTDAGFDITPFGKNTIMINGLPGFQLEFDEKSLIENLIHDLSNQASHSDKSLRRKLMAQSLSQQICKNCVGSLPIHAVKSLISELFLCDNPDTDPLGKPVYKMVKIDDWDKWMK